MRTYRNKKRHIKIEIVPDQLYHIIWDYGYGDWGVSEYGLTAEQAIKLYNEKTNQNLTTIEECLLDDHYIYSVEYGYGDDNPNWEDS